MKNILNKIFQGNTLNFFIVVYYLIIFSIYFYIQKNFINNHLVLIYNNVIFTFLTFFYYFIFGNFIKTKFLRNIFNLIYLLLVFVFYYFNLKFHLVYLIVLFFFIIDFLFQILVVNKEKIKEIQQFNNEEIHNNNTENLLGSVIQNIENNGTNILQELNNNNEIKDGIIKYNDFITIKTTEEEKDKVFNNIEDLISDFEFEEKTK